MDKVVESERLCVEDAKVVIRFLRAARALDDNIRARVNEAGPGRCEALVRDVVVPNWDRRMGMLGFCQRATRRASGAGAGAGEAAPAASGAHNGSSNEWPSGSPNEISGLNGVDADASDDLARFRGLSEDERNEMLRIDPYGFKGLLRRQLDYERQAQGMRWMYDREQEVDLVVRQRTAEVLKDMCNVEVDERYTVHPGPKAP